jgi:nuclear pore complex protein Nup107
MCEEKETAEMRKLGGGWWEGGVEAVEHVTEEDVDAMEDKESEDEHEWENEIKASLDGMKSVEVEDG